MVFILGLRAFQTAWMGWEKMPCLWGCQWLCVCPCVCVGEVCLCVHEWMTEFMCVCLFDEVSDTSSREGSWVLSFFFFGSMRIWPLSLFQLLDLYVAGKVIVSQDLLQNLHVLSLVSWLFSDFIHSLNALNMHVSLAFIH